MLVLISSGNLHPIKKDRRVNRTFVFSGKQNFHCLFVRFRIKRYATLLIIKKGQYSTLTIIENEKIYHTNN